MGLIGLVHLSATFSARVKAAADAENHAKRMLRYQSTLFELARMDKSDFPVAIKIILRAVANTLDLSYAAILDFCETKRTLSCRALYLAEIDSMMDENLLWVFKEEDYPGYFATILANAPLIVEDAQHDAKTLEFHDRLKELDITSILDVPIWLDGDVIAVFWCGMTCLKRSWDSHDISFALAVANQIALSLEAVARLKAEENLRQAAEDVRKALEREQELNELKSRFIAMASHEFRTPLTTILSATEMLETYADRLDAQKKANLTEMIKGAVKNMTHLLDEVLFIGKADTGHLSFQPQPTSIDALCREFIAEVSSGIGKKHQILYQSPVRASIRLVLDAFLLRKIVLNLLGNSVKFSAPGSSVILSWHVLESTLVLTIVDQGIGIPLEDQGQLFTTFYRAKNVRNIQGTGLGLAIVKQCTELHGGTISFSSELGKGTTFSIAIPVQSG
ncbi:GAF domain-containing sensor histidine kinase [Methylocucumis oryzae]|uniref:GAF domain-containing sensor histidine kinase n=1 Tax=Methylocucumis oryzae TaxID=1632867 RepID=UPI00069723EF|nr:HAMP domain-containing sensor histidine kinase [Methylocucumis oryzae]